jgi:hypothetical protein
MQEDISIRPSHGWRLAALALTLACCAFTGWLLGHAVVLFAPVVDYLAQVIDDVHAVPVMREFMARVSGS